MKLDDILYGAARVMLGNIKKEWHLQGHHLTGAFEDSLEINVVKNTFEIVGLDYGFKVDQGVAPEDISPKILPGLKRYFMLRGLNEQDATRAAGATLRVQQREGMSTQASKRFSRTGARQNFIEAATYYPDLDNFLDSTFNFGIDEEFDKIKSETI